jgi:DNA repair protein RecO (recombination protein O)
MVARVLVMPAIVLRTVDYGEADRVVTLLSRDEGKLSAIARGARKSKRRFGAALSLFGVGEARLTERPGAELARLESFSSARGFPGLYTDVAKVAHASYACELVRELAPPRHAEPVLFDLLLDFLALLDEGPARAETLRVLELRALDAVGLRPQLDACVVCSTDRLDDEGQVFDIRKGGVVCASCHGSGRPLDGATRRALCEAQSLALAGARDLLLDPAVNAGCRELLAAFIFDHLGRPLKSVEFIAKLNHA